MKELARQVIPDAERILLSLAQAVVLLDPDMRIAGVNPAAEQFLGQSAKRLRARELSKTITFEDSRMMDRLRANETPISAREIQADVAGIGQRSVDVTIAPIADSDGWQLLTLHDNRAVEALGEDSGVPGDSVLRGPEILAHEIKNPLAGIRGAAQLLARKVKGKDRALTILIADEVDRIAKLIEQMQLLSGKTTAPVVPCNLHEVARQAIAIVTTAWDSQGGGIKIREEFDPSLPDVLCNPDGMVQILINLLSNAFEAGQGAKNLEISVRTRFASGLQLHAPNSSKAVRLPVELRVSDNGPGIDPALRDHIFEPFVTSKKSGQGLGLALVRKLVRDMNGRISHDRDEAGLTNFRLHLPLASEVNAEASELEKAK